MDGLCFGKLPARPNSIKFKLSTYVDLTVLPSIPKDFGHEENMPVPWGMLGNNVWGDCLAEGTLVSGPDINGAYKIPYRGVLVTFTLASGKRITVTPKHSFLTPEGFAPANTIKKGDYLVGTRGTQILPRAAMSSCHAYLNNNPAPIEKVFSALVLSGCTTRKVVPRSVDFHGDEKLFEGNVQIVWADRFLGDKSYATLGEPYAKNQIGPARQLKGAFVRARATLLAQWRSFLATHGNVGLGGYGPAFAYAHSGISQPQLLSLSSKRVAGSNDSFLQESAWDTSLLMGVSKRRAVDIHLDRLADIAVTSRGGKPSDLGVRSAELIANQSHPSPNCFRTDPHLFGNIRDAFPSLIETDCVINIDIQGDVRTHVYDLSTNSHWYLAEGIVSHNCVVAGGAHEHMLWAHMAGGSLSFNTADVGKDFTGITGHQPSALVGADMQQAASYRLKKGLLGADGKRHKIAAYLEIRPGNLKELYAAMYLFGAVGVGVAIHSAQMDQFTKHKAWAVAGGVYEGLHYVPCVALRSNIVCVTWGRFQAVRPSFIAAECDEAVAYISQEALTAGKSPEGFDYQALLADLAALRTV